jgi:hypothetical protein
MIKLRMFNLLTVPTTTLFLSPHPLLRLAHIKLFADDIFVYSPQIDIPSGRTSSDGILEQSIGARNRVGIGLSFRPARLNRLAESIPKFKNTISVFICQAVAGVQVI